MRKKSIAKGDYEIVDKGNNLFDIINCQAGSIYGDKAILRIYDLEGKEGYYLYRINNGLYEKVDPNASEHSRKPCRYYGNPAHEDNRAKAFNSWENYGVKLALHRAKMPLWVRIFC